MAGDLRRRWGRWNLAVALPAPFHHWTELYLLVCALEVSGRLGSAMGPRGATGWPGLIPLIKEDGDLLVGQT